jgi:predicted alpha/beta-fold hydrolase
MPLVTSHYRAPRWLRGGHAQTILPVLLPKRHPGRWSRERLRLPDGDFLDLFWLRQGANRLAILSHGLEGSAEANYMRGMAATLAAAGWDVLAWNYRGCGGVENDLPRSYHSGESGDLRQVITHAAREHSRIALIGFSLGGNISLKCVGEAPAHPAVCAVVAISSPVDLASSARVLDEDPRNRLYLHRFLKSLKVKTLRKSRRFPELRARLAGKDGIDAVTTIKEFDERVTAPLHGFENADDYWARASALPHLPNIQVPSLLLSARNDPLLAAPSFPEAAALQNPHFHLEAPAHGGHVGFIDFRAGLQPWSERRVLAFLDSLPISNSA